MRSAPGTKVIPPPDIEPSDFEKLEIAAAAGAAVGRKAHLTFVIVLDDTGFGHLDCYGSPIRTPNLDKLAKNGLLYNNMHTTALCSPSRSCMLTGRNHSNGMACIAEGSEGRPGSNGAIPFECRCRVTREEWQEKRNGK